MDYVFEPARESDWTRIIEWQAEIEWVGLPHARQDGISRDTSIARLRERLAQLRADEDFRSEALVARAPDASLAGYVWVAKTHNDRTGRLEASLLGQYVAPAHRDRGLGGKLLELAEEWACKRGLPCLCLFVSADNTIAQRLYRSLGYEVEGLRMEKVLIPSADEGASTRC